jgi:cyanophycinase
LTIKHNAGAAGSACCREYRTSTGAAAPGNRLLSLVLERPQLVGIGVDESTALEVGPDGLWRVRGSGVALVYDARDARVATEGAHQLAAADVRVHVLPSGSSFDPRTRQVTLPPAR